MREAGAVRELWIHRVQSTKVERLLYLDRTGAAKLIELIRALDHIPVEGGDTVRIDDELLHDIFTDPDAVRILYERNPGGFREAIESDESARDLIALAHRRGQLERFRRLLSNPEYFASESADLGSPGPERVWQHFLEENPWILGVSLAGQLLVSWNEAKLEQVVAGFSIARSGKRTDALMRTAGRIHSMVFAEIKHHATPLLGSEYRPDCWAPSRDLAGGVTQIQQTVYQAVRQIGERLADTDEEGVDTGEYTYLIRPRSFLVVGNLDELRGQSGIHQEKHRSFELYRRNLYEPEVITFDELLTRAEWHVVSAEQDAAQEST